MDLLSVSHINKRYETFALRDVSFSLGKGYIMGFIGRNGAGKTTTLKTMLGLVHADSGQVTLLGQDSHQNELALRQQVSLMLGGANYYPRQRLRAIAGVVRRFYTEWDEAAFQGYLRRFELDPAKRVDELSTGMKVKFSLALALSHNARLLILDEPTSGLDPVSRDDLLELFQEVIEDGERSILFSTQITSDLEKCADYITYIKDGRIVASDDKDSFLSAYRVVKGGNDQFTDSLRGRLIGYKKNAFGFSGLMRAADATSSTGLQTMPADIESIMIYFEKEQKA